MDTVITKEVVETTLTRRGEGTVGSPVRIIKQIWEKDGTLIAEVDPYREIEVDEERSKLIKAIKWALGEEGDFPPKPEGKAAGNYWWRTELRRRAGL